MIDIDSESSQRANILKLTKERFGNDKVLNMGTFTTEGPKSTVITACRGLGVDVDISHNIANLIPSDKTEMWSAHDCLYGNEDKGRKPVRQFVDLVRSYEGLEDTIVGIEGITSGRSQHTSGQL